eukprot:763612-Hanusia_phi.AAC.18
MQQYECRESEEGAGGRSAGEQGKERGQEGARSKSQDRKMIWRVKSGRTELKEGGGKLFGWNLSLQLRRNSREGGSDESDALNDGKEDVKV